MGLPFSISNGFSVTETALKKGTVLRHRISGVSEVLFTLNSDYTIGDGRHVLIPSPDSIVISTEKGMLKHPELYKRLIEHLTFSEEHLYFSVVRKEATLSAYRKACAPMETTTHKVAKADDHFGVEVYIRSLAGIWEWYRGVFQLYDKIDPHTPEKLPLVRGSLVLVKSKHSGRVLSMLDGEPLNGCEASSFLGDIEEVLISGVKAVGVSTIYYFSPSEEECTWYEEASSV
nr:MAG TPA: hypothetical protein [Caudoviricetes sp.]